MRLNLATTEPLFFVVEAITSPLDDWEIIGIFSTELDAHAFRDEANSKPENINSATVHKGTMAQIRRSILMTEASLISGELKALLAKAMQA